MGFTVAATGRVERVRIECGLNPAADAAVLAAVRQLPRLSPGHDDGRTFAVRYVFAVAVPR